MAKHNSQAAAKQTRNEANASRYPRRDKAARRRARTERTVVRETRWLVAHGETPNPVKPPPARRKRRR